MSIKNLLLGTASLNADEPSWGNVAMHLTMDGANNATTTVDSRTSISYAITRGNLSTATKKFGTASLNLKPTFQGASYISSTHAVLRDILFRPFVIRGWFYFDTTGDRRIMSAGGGAAGWNSTNGIHWLFQRLSSGVLNFQLYNGSAAAGVSTTGTVSNNTWVYITLCWDYVYKRVYIGINGKVQTLYATTPVKPSGAPTLMLGSIPGDSYTYGFSGFIDDFQLILDEVLHTSDFDVPTEPALIGDVVGQTVLSTTTLTNPNTPVTTSMVVQPGISKVSAVVVGSGRRDYIPGSMKIYRKVGGENIILLSDTSIIGDEFGGGDGGEPGTPAPAGDSNEGNGEGSGGAGGYFGDGGRGGNGGTKDGRPTSGQAGTGGASGGGSGTSGYNTPGGIGGKTGLNGVGADGAINILPGGAGGDGSNGPLSTTYAGGGTHQITSSNQALAGSPAGRGGNLRYTKHPVSVTPGETIYFDLFIGGAIRLIWGGGRSYPYNARDTVI